MMKRDRCIAALLAHLPPDGVFADFGRDVLPLYANGTIKPLIDELRSLSGGGGPSGQGLLTQPDAQRLRRENFRDRGRLWPPIQPQGFLPGGGAAQPQNFSAAGGPNGQVEVLVRFDGAPPGTRAEAASTGAGIAAPVLQVGYAFGRRTSFA